MRKVNKAGGVVVPAQIFVRVCWMKHKKGHVVYDQEAMTDAFNAAFEALPGGTLTYNQYQGKQELSDQHEDKGNITGDHSCGGAFNVKT